MGFANLTNRPERRPIALAVTSSVVALLITLGHGALWANGRQYGDYLETRFEERGLERVSCLLEPLIAVAELESRKPVLTPISWVSSRTDLLARLRKPASGQCHSGNHWCFRMPVVTFASVSMTNIREVSAW